jgi:hypothetical protein
MCAGQSMKSNETAKAASNHEPPSQGWRTKKIYGMLYDGHRRQPFK